MFLNLLVAIMVIPTTTAVTIIVVIILQATITDTHILKAKLPSRLKYLCIMAARQQSVDMEALALSNHSKLVLPALNHMLAHPLNLCKAWYPVNH
jgi:low affinity Fe/Cu permease